MYLYEMFVRRTVRLAKCHILPLVVRSIVRDLVGGDRGCSMYCRMRGHRDGACAWDTESGANDCHCDTELRGIR